MLCLPRLSRLEVLGHLQRRRIGTRGPHDRGAADARVVRTAGALDLDHVCAEVAEARWIPPVLTRPRRGQAPADLPRASARRVTAALSTMVKGRSGATAEPVPKLPPAPCERVERRGPRHRSGRDRPGISPRPSTRSAAGACAWRSRGRSRVSASAGSVRAITRGSRSLLVRVQRGSANHLDQRGPVLKATAHQTEEAVLAPRTARTGNSRRSRWRGGHRGTSERHRARTS